MTGDMPRKLPPFVVRERTRHKTVVLYFRRGKGKRTRLPDMGSPDFDEAYQACLAGQKFARPVVAAGTLHWLIDRYRETAAYQSLSYATRRQRDNIFKGVIGLSGSTAYAKVKESDIVKGRERRANTPAQARNFLDAMRGLFRWAREAGHITADPSASVRNPKRRDGDGFTSWDLEDVVTYEERWPDGSKERVWLHVLLYTGLRRGDAVRLGKQHVKNGVAAIKTEKSRHTVEVTLPILPPLARTLKIGPTSDLAFICGETGKPLTKESFGNFFRAACNKAGVSKSAHGVRKLAATIAAEAGATVNELEARFGWSGGAMASLYTKKADRKRLAIQASDKIVNAIPRTFKSGAGKASKKATKSIL